MKNKLSKLDRNLRFKFNIQGNKTQMGEIKHKWNKTQPLRYVLHLNNMLKEKIERSNQTDL